MGRSGHNETTIEELRSALAATHCDLYARYRIRSLGVFGSRVRGDARPDSDVDVLVDFDRAPTFFEFVRLEDELSRLLGLRVDLVMRRALHPELVEQILAEVVSCDG